jgi:hypothetical protein
MFIKEILLVAIFLNILLGIFVFYTAPKTRTKNYFAFLCLVAGIWSFINYTTTISPTIWWVEVSYSTGVLLVASGLFWIQALIDEKQNSRFKAITYLVVLIVFFLPYIPNFMIKSYGDVNTDLFLSGKIGVGFIVYILYYTVCCGYVLCKLYKFYNKTQDKTKRKQAGLIFVGLIITIAGSAITSILLPVFSIFVFAGIDSLFFLVFLFFIAYTITKHQLFQIEIIMSHIVILVLWLILFINIDLSTNSSSFVGNVSLFVIVFILSIIFMQNLLQSIAQRNQISLLSKKLQEAYEVLSRTKQE